MVFFFFFIVQYYINTIVQVEILNHLTFYAVILHIVFQFNKLWNIILIVLKVFIISVRFQRHVLSTNIFNTIHSK